jgi:hypothetical protein
VARGPPFTSRCSKIMQLLMMSVFCSLLTLFIFHVFRCAEQETWRNGRAV